MGSTRSLRIRGLQAVGQVKTWKVKQIVFVGGTCGSIHVESFNGNMKALGVLESKWDPIRKKLVRRLLEEQDKVLRSYFVQTGGTRKGEDRSNCKGREQVGHVCVRITRADRGQVTNSRVKGEHGERGCFVVYYFLWLGLLGLSLIKSPC